MRDLNQIKLGELLRKKRKELGFRLEDLADEQISTSTISNIERGMPNVNQEKISYFASKLGLSLDQIPELLSEEKEKDEKIELQLKSIENIIDLSSPEKGLERLKQVHIASTTSPFSPIVHYLKGKCYFQKKNWSKAQTYFLEAIRLIDQTTDLKVVNSNIKASCYNELGRISYFNNEIDQAIQYVQSGIDAFIDCGERKYYKHVLIINQAIYLEKLDRTEEALRMIIDLWVQIEYIESLDVILIMYHLRATILKKLKLYEESIEYAMSGIQLSRINKVYERSFELWTTLGSVYIETGDLEAAENCFLTALELTDKIRKEYLFIYIYIQLGQVYLEQQKWDQAQKFLEEAVRFGEKTNNVIRYIQALQALGDCYLKQKKYKDAIEPFQQALELAQKHSFQNQEYEILIRLAECWEKIDRRKFQNYVESMFRVELQLRKGGKKL